MLIDEINNWFEPEWGWGEDEMAKNVWQAGDPTGGAPHKHVVYHQHFMERIEVTVRPVRVGSCMRYMDGHGTFYPNREVRRVPAGPMKFRTGGKKKAARRL